ncbi:hypothetical protein DL93DRAFT_2086051 [Clavulina sp. PMI_390]|nr:hypothetical protein DL93DRAFT_2086051 [Clavulina sp. PMI_390]
MGMGSNSGLLRVNLWKPLSGSSALNEDETGVMTPSTRGLGGPQTRSPGDIQNARSAPALPPVSVRTA